MNKRIHELAREAGLPTYNPQGIPTKLEKFAELLVRECYEHCRGQILDKEFADTNKLTYNDAVMDCSNGLLQHFGVDA